LTYKLERKNTEQFNKDDLSNEDKKTCVQLVITWGFNGSNEFLVFSSMFEYYKNFWDEYRLLELVKWYRYKLYDIQHCPIEETYLMHDNTVLMIRVNVTYEEEYYKLDITISETSLKDDTQRLWYIYTRE
jgi:hypothetical protein